MQKLFIYEPDPWYVEIGNIDFGRKRIVEVEGKDAIEAEESLIPMFLGYDEWASNGPRYSNLRIYCMDGDHSNYVFQEQRWAPKSMLETIASRYGYTVTKTMHDALVPPCQGSPIA
jgi:hypothetical protein